MRDLLADRFVAFERTWIDVSSGARVRLRLHRRHEISEAIVWSDLCAERARLRHPLMNVLLDYGVADIGRTFEAYSVGEPIRAPGRAASQLMQHAGRFMESRGCHFRRTSLESSCARSCSAGRFGSPSTGARPRRRRAAGVRLSSGRPLGLILQPRAILESLSEALEVAAPGGTTSVEIAGGRGSGIRTTRLLAARTARLAGFVPVASSVLTSPSVAARAAWPDGICACCSTTTRSMNGRRSRCSWLGLESPARGGTCCSDSLERKRRVSGARWIDTMGIAAMTSMVFVDGDNGPSHEELFDAARGASGRPGLFLERLRATHVDEPAARIALVHESSPAYVFGQPASGTGVTRRRPGAARRPGARRAGSPRAADTRRRSVCWRGRRACSRPAGRRRWPRPAPSSWPGSTAIVATAAGHWNSSSVRGRSRRQVSLRLARPLSSAPHAIAARPSTSRRPDCKTTRAALARSLASGLSGPTSGASIEAEASLRGACAAADLLGDLRLGNRARRALARCLYWQSRYDEAAMVLEALVRPAPSDGQTARAESKHGRSWPARERPWATFGRRSPPRAKRSNARGEIECHACRPRRSEAWRSSSGWWETTSRSECWSERAVRTAAAGAPSARGTSREVPARDQPRVCAGPWRRATRGWSAFERRWHAAGCRPCFAWNRGGRARAEWGRSRTRPGECAGEGDARPRSVAGNGARGGRRDRRTRRGVPVRCERLRAASVQIVTGPPEPRMLARAGRPWQGDSALVDPGSRRGASGTGIPLAESGEPRQAAEPIRFGREAIAVLVLPLDRWAP